MYLNDDIWHQCLVYNNLSSIIDKYRYADEVLYYYDTHPYISIKRGWCYKYWKSVRNDLDFYFS